MNHTLKGQILTRTVWLDGVQLSPARSQKVYNHSPNGFNWGYGGSGPAQLALAMMLELTGGEMKLVSLWLFQMAAQSETITARVAKSCIYYLPASAF